MSEKQPNNDSISMSRRKLLGSAAVIGGAGALGAGGTSALFWDEEVFGNADSPNVLQAGALDLKVDWDVRYYDGIDSTAPDADSQTGGTIDATSMDNQPEGEVMVDQPGPLVQLRDVKPGDVIEKTLSLHLYDNPGFVSIAGEITTDSDSGITEPEDKVNGHQADGSDGDPFTQAGMGIGAAGLLASKVKNRFMDQESEDASSSLSKKSIMRGAGAATAAAAGLGAISGTASAAIGDELGVVSLPGQQAGQDGPEGFTCSVAGTFDGDYYTTTDDTGSCGSSTIQIYEPPADGDGQATLVAEKTVVDQNGNIVNDVTALFWDPSRNQYWAGHGGGDIYLVDRGDPTDGTQDATATHQFTATEQYANGGIIDGLARDDEDDTLYISDDATGGLEHYDIDGTHLGTIVPETDSAGDEGGGISGIAIGAPIDGRKTLYLGRSGFGEIVRVYADSGEFHSKFAQNVSERVEDLACDPVTYDSSAILSKDAYNGIYTALEVEEGTCPLSGGGGDEPDDGDDGDGELDNLMECVVWYDGNDAGQETGGDNFPEEILPAEHGYSPGGDDFLLDLTNGDIQFEENDNHLFQGSLREMLDSVEDGRLLDGSGSHPGDFEFPNSMCYDNSTTHYLGVLCWVPRDIPGYNDNIIQSDTVEYYFGFNAIQCRHNVDDDGGPIRGTIADADAENNAMVDGGGGG